MRHRFKNGEARWLEHTRSQHVMVQNQRSPGNLGKEWDRTGVVVGCPLYNK